MRRDRCVKILATLGPASSSAEQIETLFNAGVDVFRINMSHTSHERLLELHKSIRKVETKCGRPIGILCDLQGPKLRISTFKDKHINLAYGDTFTIDNNNSPGDATRVYLPHPEIFEAVEPGQRLLLDDGKIELKVISCDGNKITTEVIYGGSLSANKGISLPDTLLPFSAMTDKDKEDLEFAANLGIDWIALSFVQRPEDVIETRTRAGSRCAVMAKIEKPSAIECIDEILKHVDGIMVARGDLGVEMPIQDVPGLQKRLIRASRREGKPVVVATQMLESMIEAPVPTRAEVSDVATAVFEGADAIMLSAESAVGKYPEKAVRMMDEIAISVERDENYLQILTAQRNLPENNTADAIAAASHTASETLKLAAIVCYTGSGTTGLRTARQRPTEPIIALSPIAATGRRLALVWGLHCVLTADAENLEDMVDRACRIAFQEGIAKLGERIAITAGVPLGTPGATNMLRIAYVGEEADEYKKPL